MKENELLSLVADLVNKPVSTINLKMPLESIPEFDSITLLGIITAVEEEGKSLDLEMFENIKTLNDILKIVKS